MTRPLSTAAIPERKRKQTQANSTLSIPHAIDLSPEPDRSIKMARADNPTTRQTSVEQHLSLFVDDMLPDFRVAIDFGTKFTTIACAKGDEDQTSIFTIEEFPDDPLPGRAGTQVPTEIAYLPKQTNRHVKEQPVKNLVYGYEIQSRHEIPGKNYKEIGHITNIKLLLDKSPHLKYLRKAVVDTLKTLKTAGIIKKDEEVIYDLLVCYFNHAKEILRRDHGLKKNSKVEITFCVPVCWSPAAHTTMSDCLKAALETVKLGVDSSGIHHLFMVNEAEAAAMYALTSKFHQLKWGEVFLLLDCGGGTTDVGMYGIDHEHPFRLGKEIVPTTGAICGSGDLNIRFRDFAIQQLKDAQYPEKADIPIEKIINSELMPRFENVVKRSFSLRSKSYDKTPSYPFPLRGLIAEKNNSRIKEGSFVLSFEDMESIFMPSFKTITLLMENQINKALRAKASVDKVILAGGFGDSPALKDFLSSTLARINEEKGTTIELIVTPPNTGASGVAKGALMRAQNKNHGPERTPCQSVGVYHHIRNDPEMYTNEVLFQTSSDDWEKSPVDGYSYLRHTIKWVFKKGEGKLKRVHEFQWKDEHVFTPAHTRGWIAEYALFASDTCTEDFFTRSHPKNRGKTFEIGKVVFDLVPIKQHVQLYIPKDEDDGQKRYEVNVIINMKLIDKHLDFTAFWPSAEEPLVTIRGNHKHLNLISVFEPGTA